MGILSNQVVASGGTVIGVVPSAMVAAGGEGSGPIENLNTRVLNLAPDTTQFRHIVVGSMHERKTLMAKFAGAGFMALPGGFGTFEEVLEMVTWSQLGIHQKRNGIICWNFNQDADVLFLAMILINVKSFWEPLRTLINNSIQEGFIQENKRDLVIFVDGSGGDDFDWGQAAVDALEKWEAPSDGGLYTWKAT